MFYKLDMTLVVLMKTGCGEQQEILTMSRLSTLPCGMKSKAHKTHKDHETPPPQQAHHEALLLHQISIVI